MAGNVVTYSSHINMIIIIIIIIINISIKPLG